MSKCELDTEPDFEFSSLLVHVPPVYVVQATYDFILSKKKRVDRNLDAYYIGVNDLVANRDHRLSLSLPETRAPIFAMYGDLQNPNT